MTKQQALPIFEGYTTQRCISTDANGSVYIVKHNQTNKLYVYKLITSKIRGKKSQENVAKDLYRYIKINSHPHLAQYYAYKLDKHG
mmetsp:Transcript_29074/g.26446  ORF Transcript_29074/g.26446 Transcript_29074/m.26446 type:complete len:86 (-) Transcript_29074:1312-1569(-)